MRPYRRFLENPQDVGQLSQIAECLDPREVQVRTHPAEDMPQNGLPPKGSVHIDANNYSHELDPMDRGRATASNR